MITDFERELAALINKYSLENKSNTPDWILAQYLTRCLEDVSTIINTRSKWYNRYDKPGQSFTTMEDEN